MPRRIYSVPIPDQKGPEPEFNCPSCGTKLLKLGIASIFEDEDSGKRIITDLHSPQFKAFKRTPAGVRMRKTQGAYYYTCIKCKHILLKYGREMGFYFDVVGAITDDIVATLLAGLIKD